MDKQTKDLVETLKDIIQLLERGERTAEKTTEQLGIKKNNIAFMLINPDEPVSRIREKHKTYIEIYGQVTNDEGQIIY